MIIALDEGWRVASHIGVAEWLQQSWKLCRANGVQNIMVLHRLSDLGTAGATGSREARIAEGLIADSDTKVIYAQAPDQLGAVREMLGLSATETELLPTLRRRRGALGRGAAQLPRPAPALGAGARAGRHRRADAAAPARRGARRMSALEKENGPLLALGGCLVLLLGWIWLSGGLAAWLFGSGWISVSPHAAARNRARASLPSRRPTAGLAKGSEGGTARGGGPLPRRRPGGGGSERALLPGLVGSAPAGSPALGGLRSQPAERPLGAQG